MESITAMFPDMDKDLIADLFRENGDNVERTINQLLEMADPSAKPTQPTPTVKQPTLQEEQDAAYAKQLAQQLSDEEYARRLAEEEAATIRAQEHLQRGEDEGPSFEETIIKKATEFGESAKAGFKNLFNKISSAIKPNDRETSSSQAQGPYVDLPKDDFDEFLESNSSKEQPLARSNQ